MNRIPCTAFLSIVLVGPARAQERVGPPPGPAFALFRPAPTLPPTRPASLIQSTARNHFWQGAVIGGVIGAVFFVVTANGFCDQGSTADCFPAMLVAAPIGFVVGGAVGGLVGAFIPKKPRPSTH